MNLNLSLTLLDVKLVSFIIDLENKNINIKGKKTNFLSFFTLDTFPTLSIPTYSHFFLLTFLGLGNEKNSVESFVYLRTEMTWLTLRSLGSGLRRENNMFIQEMIFRGGGSKPFSRKDKYLLSGIGIDTVFRVPVNFATSIKLK